MTFLEKIQVIERVDCLIRRSATGAPKELAVRLSVSERTVYDLINIMKKMDAPIYFCASKNSYRYQYDVELAVGFMAKSQNIIKTRGGNGSNKFPETLSLRNFCSGSYYI